MLEEHSRFAKGKKTCDECLERHRDRTRLKRRKAKQAASTSSTSKKRKT
jgi:hypothetical protein